MIFTRVSVEEMAKVLGILFKVPVAILPVEGGIKLLSGRKFSEQDVCVILRNLPGSADVAVG